jgi:hypothetical protein
MSARTCRAGRTRRPRARLRVEIRRKNAACKPNRNQSVRVACVPGRIVTFADPDPSIAPRAFHARAVLGVVNALRCASTRPMAGPAGIDDASARHVSGTYAMVRSVSIPQVVLTRESRRRMLTSSRQCPHGTSSGRPKGQRSAHPVGPTGHDIERTPKHRRLMHDDRERSGGASFELRISDLSRRIILRITRCAEDMFTSGVALPWCD